MQNSQHVAYPPRQRDPASDRRLADLLAQNILQHRAEMLTAAIRSWQAAERAGRSDPRRFARADLAS